jgi:hypothetical protein
MCWFCHSTARFFRVYRQTASGRKPFINCRYDKLRTTMKPKNPIESAQSTDKLRIRADALSRSPRLIQVCQSACFDEDVRAKALNDPMAFLGSRGIKIPPGITVEFFEYPPKYLPFPDWTPFIFEFTNCRTYWLKECDDSEPPKCLLKEVTICFGFRLYANPVQPRG